MCVIPAVYTLDSVGLHNRCDYIVFVTGSLYNELCCLTQQVGLYFICFSQCLHWTVFPFTTAGIISNVAQSVCTLDSVNFHNRRDYISCGSVSAYTGQSCLSQQLGLYFMLFSQCVNSTMLAFTTARVILCVEQAVCTLESVVLHNRWNYIVLVRGSV